MVDFPSYKAVGTHSGVVDETEAGHFIVSTYPARVETDARFQVYKTAGVNRTPASVP